MQFYSSDPLVLFGLIATAPLVLGVISRFAGIRQETVNRTNADLERNVRERTEALRSMLDLSGQGFLSFGKDYRVEPEYSRECEQFFDRRIEGLDVSELLFRDPKEAEDFRSGTSLIFDGKAKPEVVFDILDHETMAHSRSLRIDYRMITDERIMCVLTDTTNERALEDRTRQENERRSIIMKSVTNRDYFASFVREAGELMDELTLYERKAPTEVELREIMRTIHTFKGNASFFDFSLTHEVATDFENHIADSLALEEEASMKELTIDLKRAYYTELQIINETLGKQWMNQADGVVVPRRDYMKIERYVKTRYSKDARLGLVIERYRRLPLSYLFARFPDMAKALSERLGKRLKPLVIEGGDFLVLPERFRRLVDSMVHLVRNAVDHGIEPPYEREVHQKEEAGQISIHLGQTGNAITVVFSDDGRGISLSSVESRARELGLLNGRTELSDQEILGLIFADQFSTAEEVGDISGRGVGLAAVRHEVERLHARISVATRLNEGTSFEITIPIRNREGAR
jgi:two-component system chemotaxis sensor kinase CheA